MTAPRDPDRMIHHFLMDGGEQLHDQVYDAVRAGIETKPQRVFIGPWRMPLMNKIVPLGLGAAAVVVAAVLGTQLLAAPAPEGVGAVPSVQPSAMPSPTPTSAPSASAATSPPPLTQIFTSQMHGISVSYPEGWTAQAATEPWTGGPSSHSLDDPEHADHLFDPILTDHLFLTMTSQPIGDATPDEWMAAQMAGECTATEPIAVGEASGLIGSEGCDLAVVTTDGRGYWMILRRSGDDPSAVASYDRAWFEEVLATVKLQPEDAVDVAPSATP